MNHPHTSPTNRSSARNNDQHRHTPTSDSHHVSHAAGLDTPSCHQAADIGKSQLFIGGLASTTDLKELQCHLKSIIEMPSSEMFISLVKRLKRRTFSGYGIVKNLMPDEAKCLLAIGNLKFKGIWISIKPFLKNKSVISVMRNDRTEKKIYLKGITEALRESDLEKYFGQFGSIVHVQIGKYQYTNIYKGFGFIEFTSRDAIEAVLQKNQHVVYGVTISCEKSKTNNSSQQRPAQDQSRDPNTYDQSRSRIFDSDESKKHNYRERYIECGTVADHFKPFTHAVDRVAWNHTKNNLVFRIPASSQ